VAAARLPHLDNLKTLLVAWVIGGHALLGYSATGGWAYDEVREVTLRPRRSCGWWRSSDRPGCS
jgi:hypothetical protein